MTSCVLDASAVIALLRQETGWKEVVKRLPDAALSSVNAGEVLLKLVEKGVPLETAIFQLNRLRVERVSFDDDQAAVVASFWKATHKKDISLADRACMALAMIRNCPVLTSDSKWTKIDVGVMVELFR